MAHDRGDFARLLMARGNHERRFTGPACLEVLLDRSLPQFHAIGNLFDDSMVLSCIASSGCSSASADA
jgi:uncharacterized Ntn-hydrolase superfamily protein